MKKYILFLILSFLNSNIFADDNIFGYWLTSGSIVEIENCNNQVCGKIVTVFVEDGVDPESILDENNKDKSQQGGGDSTYNVYNNGQLVATGTS